MNPKIIRNLEDHAVAMARLSALMSSNPAPGSKGENELELLALVIEDFERRTVPPVQADPVEAILFRMEQMKMARKDLVPYIGSISKVSEVLSRKRPLSLCNRASCRFTQSCLSHNGIAGWRTRATGASRANCGGAIVSLPTCAPSRATRHPTPMTQLTG